MKKTFATYAATFALIFFSLNSFGQDNNQHMPKWVSENGYWMMESNIHQPKQYTVWFYNNQNVMIGKQEITGKKMNANRKSVKMQLKALLENSLVAWNNQHPVSDTAAVAKRP